jgi:alkylation response protein AidB-like acyl-CoA dehydrogenase
MDFNLSTTQNAWQARAEQMAYRLPAETAPGDVVRAASLAQLLDPEEDLLSAAVATEAVAHRSASAGIIFALQSAVIRAVGSGHPAASRLLRGELVGAFALASDTYPAGHGQLSGRAAWVAPITHGGLAMVGASHDGRLVAQTVALDDPAVSVQRIDTVALEGIDCGHLTLTNAPAVPVGPTPPVMACVRILLASAGIGMGRRALFEALQVARAFDRTGAGGEQTVQGLLADSATELDAAMLLTWKAASARTLSLGDASIAKLAATEATQRAVLRATQVIGGDSFKSGHVIDRLARDVRALELFAGRTEALREAAAQEVLRID